LGEVVVGVDQGNSRKKLAASSKKPSVAKRKTVKRKINFKDSPWYERAVQSISASPNREQRP
jgi:hypothetical protein